MQQSTRNAINLLNQGNGTSGTIIYALNIIEMALTKQDAFLDAHFTANSSILLTGLNKLVLDINPRRGMSDHMLNITKMVTYNSTMPLHCLSAVKILRLIIRQPNINNQLLGVSPVTIALSWKFASIGWVVLDSQKISHRKSSIEIAKLERSMREHQTFSSAQWQNSSRRIFKNNCPLLILKFLTGNFPNKIL